MELEESTILTSDYTTSCSHKVWYWHKDRSTAKCNTIESPEMNACIQGHHIFDKGSKNIQWRKDNLFNKWFRENWSTTCKRMKLEHCLTPYTQKNSKWIKGLSLRPETINFLEENTGRTLFDINHSKILYEKKSFKICLLQMFSPFCGLHFSHLWQYYFQHRDFPFYLF